MIKNRKTSKNIAIIFIIIGFLIFLYPTISNLLAKLGQAEIIKEYSEKVNSLSEEKIIEEYQKAINYNLSLVTNNILDSFKEINKEDLNQYESTLNINNDGILGYIEIPKIDVKMPIYHGTSDEVIEKGAGHISKTSFPIEGKTVHSVITSHTGLPKAKLFTGLDKLELNDLFYITILNKNFCYKVCDIKVVLPEEVDSLKIIENKNYVTLITCTPYGVNSHRLLVTGELTEYIEPQKETNLIKEVTKDKSFLYLLIPILLILIIFIIIIVKFKKKHKKEVKKNENRKTK